jgi:hypothetical protein
MWSPRPKMIVDSLWSTGNIGTICHFTVLYLSGGGKTIPGDEQFRERTHHAGKAVGRVPGIDQISRKTQTLNVGFSYKLTIKGTWPQVPEAPSPPRFKWGCKAFL